MTRNQRSTNPLSPLVKVFKSQAAKHTDALNGLVAFAAVVNGNGFNAYQVQFDRESSPTIKYYQALGSGPNIGDRVMMIRTLRSWVIVGSIFGGDSGWMTQTSNPGLITAYVPANTTVTSYNVRKIGRTVTFTCTLVAVTAVSATNQEFTILAALDPSIACDPVCDQPVGATGSHPQPSGQVTGSFLMRLRTPAAIGASTTYVMGGSYLCAG